ncbi:uncharacterized protein LOC125228236 [Leguminivora glycinivorella]|uniref:uncharacterized protein LOC125228236 n=1 Tax=Leguminivora glycinivorella TaxID=1035111 RepID=UPI00200D4743|nr:uncharacterized protein LOC125228236 [Leguminivora glycinivorella]
MEERTMGKVSFQPKTMAELLPDLALSGILSKDAILTLTGKKKPRNTMAINRTAEKVVKPLTMAEIRAELQAFKGSTPGKAQPAPSTKKKGWNSSVKVDKKINHRVEGKLKNNSVRKVLNFPPPRPVAPVQAKTINSRVSMMPPAHSRMTLTAPVSKARMTLMPPETPKFPKPEHRAKKALYIQAKTNVRISGICNIPETPVETKPAKPRVTIANKENSSYQANINRKSIAPKLINHKRLVPTKPDTPLSNDSWKSGSDASFIQKEKEIHESEAMTNAILHAQRTLEKIAEVSPPITTPFRKYRNNIESNNSSVMDNSNPENDTIMSFDNPTMLERVNNQDERLKESQKVAREERVFVSLCDMLNKATITNSESDKLDELLEVKQKQTEHNIKMIEDGIQALINIKEEQYKSLYEIKKQIREKVNSKKVSDNDKDTTLVGNTAEPQTPLKSPVLGHPCSVIRLSPKSPTYKIPKRTPCLRKKVFYKSMPSVVMTDMSTPVKLDGGKALNMYMKMKEQLHFLNTPLVKSRPAMVPDTPAITSQNLQMQLNKLYNKS